MPAYAGCDRDHTRQVVMQGATLVVRIIGAMFMLATIVMGMMMVDMSDLAAFTDVGSDILLVLEGVLDMDADQRHDACGLGEHKEPQEQRTKASKLSE